MTLCHCGNPKVPGLSICQQCLNTKKREKYHSDEGLRHKISKIGVLRHSSGAARQVYSYYRFKAYELLGGQKCSRCGFDDPRALQIDHVHNDGYLSGRQRGGLEVYQKVIKGNGVGFQILCANCNWIKRAEYQGINPGDYPKQCPPQPRKGSNS